MSVVDETAVAWRWPTAVTMPMARRRNSGTAHWFPGQSIQKLPTGILNQERRLTTELHQIQGPSRPQRSPVHLAGHGLAGAERGWPGAGEAGDVTSSSTGVSIPSSP